MRYLQRLGQPAVLVAVSTCLFLGPFFWPTLLWPFLFFFPLPFFIATTHTRFSFLCFYGWPILILGAQSFGILWGIFNLSTGPLVIRLLPLLLFISTYALYPALILWLTQKVLDHFGPLGLALHLFVWLISIWVTFLVLIEAGLWYTGTVEGYPLINPLLPLASHPELLTFILPTLGTNVTLLLLLSFSAPLAHAIVTHKWRGLWISLFLGLPWAFGWIRCHPTTTPRPAWIKKTGVTTLPPNLLLHNLSKLFSKRDRVSYLFFPESVCTGSITALCDLAAQLPNCTLIAGGFRDDQGTHCNTAWWLHGTVRGYCDKRHAMALTERVPMLVDTPAIRKAYFHHVAEVMPSKTPRPRWVLSPELTVVPYICSELFFFSKPDAPYPDPILALCYDSWPVGQYARDLLLLTARFKAIAWQRDIIYSGYAFQVVCTKHGEIYPLPRLGAA